MKIDFHADSRKTIIIKSKLLRAPPLMTYLRLCSNLKWKQNSMAMITKNNPISPFKLLTSQITLFLSRFVGRITKSLAQMALIIC